MAPRSIGNSSDSAASLIAARNPDSALFSVQEVADAVKADQAPARLALHLPASASGVVEIDPHAAMPAVAPPLLPRVASQPIAAPSNRLQWLMVGVLGTVLAGLGIVVATAQPQTVIVRTTEPAMVASAAGHEAPQRAVEPEPEPEPAAVGVVADSEPEAAKGDGATEVDAEVPEPVASEPVKAKVTAKVTAKGKTKSTSKSTSTSSSKAKSGSKASSTKTTSTASSTSTSTSKASSGMPSVECVLDPAKCDVGGAAKSTTKAVDPVADLPDKLTAAQLRDGLAAIKPQARQCGRDHGIASGTNVKVKLSIAGDSGRIVSVDVLGDYASTALAGCLEHAVEQADLPRFGAARMGAIYTLRL